MKELLLIITVVGITMTAIATQAQQASPAQIEQLSASIQGDAAKAKLFLQSFLQSRSDSKTILDCSVFIPKTVDGVDYLIAKAFVAENNVQSTARVVVYFTPTEGAAFISERAYQFFLQTGDKELLETL
jgi:hypothetical protein